MGVGKSMKLGLARHGAVRLEAVVPCGKGQPWPIFGGAERPPAHLPA